MQNQIKNLEEINYSWIKTDSIRRVQLIQYRKELLKNSERIELLEQSIKKRNNIILFGTGTLTISLCLLLLK